MRPKQMLLGTCGAALMLPLAGCISVSPPDKPIEINLNVTIQQEVLVRLQRDVEQLIQQNPEAFPQQQPPQQPQQPRQQ
jgi:YnbE-like lipoprotein